MKGIICYYSGSGNTKLACEYIKKSVRNIDFELFDIVKNENSIDFNEFDIVGFACSTDFGAAPQYFYNYFDEKIKNQNGSKPSFVFNTYGFMSVRTQNSLADLATDKGFKVITGHSLHTPENYPPMRKMKMAFDNAPKPKELKRFDNFISELDNKIEVIALGKENSTFKVKKGLISLVFPKFSREKAKEDFGIQNVSEDKCAECGICKKVCPYEAIELSPKPIFNHDKCHGCWACYNHCSSKAIYTPKFKGDFQYRKPNENLINKLKL